MARIEEQVLDRFAEKLSAAGLDGKLIEAVRGDLAAEKLPKAERLAELFAAGSGEARA